MSTCLKLLREIKDVSFGTIDEYGNPQVRIIDVMYVEDNTLYFLTARGKNFYREIKKNPKISICGLTKDFKSIRILTSVKNVSNQKEWIDKIFIENLSMNNVYGGESRFILEVFYLDRGEIEFFDLNVDPIYRETFSLNGGKIIKKGFKINSNCIECNICYDGCPQHCIIKETPYKIQQRHCLHCGLCYENCPNNGIEKRK